MKPWWKSKTVWINSLTILAWIITGLSGLTVSPWLVALFGSMLGAVNVLLRFVTTSPIIDLLFSSESKFNGIPKSNRHYNIIEYRNHEK